MMIDIDRILKWLEVAVGQYTKSAPATAEYLEGLYLRVLESPQVVTLEELRLVQQLEEDGTWLTGNFAQNLVYKVLDRCGNTGRIMVSY